MKTIILISLIVMLAVPAWGYSYDDNGNIVLSTPTQNVVKQVKRQHFLVFVDFDRHKCNWASGYRYVRRGKWSSEWFYSATFAGLSLEYTLHTLADLGLVITTSWKYKDLDHTFGIGLRFYRFKF